MLTVDLLHEFELGLWKDFLTHLIRILESLGPDSARIFNERCGRILLNAGTPTQLTPSLASDRFPRLVRRRYDILRVTSQQ